MNFKITPGKYVLYCILITLLSLIITSSFMGYLALDISPWIPAASALITGTVLYIAYIYPMFWLIAGALGSLAIGAYYIFWNRSFMYHAGTLLDTMNGCLVWFSEYLYSPVSPVPEYVCIIGTVFAVLAAAVLFLFIICWRYALLTMAAGIIILSVMWFTGYNSAFQYLKQYLFICFMLYGLINYNARENTWRLRQDILYKKIPLVWIICTLGLVALVSAAAGLMPGDMGPVNQQWMEERVYGKVRDLWNNTMGGSEFSSSIIGDKFNMSTVGYQDTPTKLGGAVKQSSVLMLKAVLEGEAAGPIYLRGTVKDTYTGSMWVKRSSNIRVFEDNKVIEGVFGDTSKVKDTRKMAVTIYPEAIKTLSIFNLWMPYRADIEDEDYYCDDDGETYFITSKGSSKEYGVESMVPLISSEDLKKVPSARNNTRNKKYLQLPDTLPDRVRSLSLLITDKHTNQYDKAKAIEKYLRDTYPYTLNTSSVPDGVDFVDYFLFEEKKGYCTYFASAMTILCRAAGIPSRYIEGVVLHDEDKDRKGVYNVMSNRAHAWVEVYFEGYGWVNFEPTGSYEEVEYNMPLPVVSNPEGSIPPTPTPSAPSPEAVNGPEDTAEKGSAKAKKGVPEGLLIFLAVILLVLLRIGAKVLLYRRSILKADKNHGKEAAMIYLALLEKKLKTVGIERSPNETSAEFGARIAPYLSSCNIDSAGLMDSFHRVRFGGVSMDEGTRHKFKDAIEKADIIYKKKAGTIKYLLGKYLF